MSNNARRILPVISIAITDYLFIFTLLHSSLPANYPRVVTFSQTWNSTLKNDTLHISTYLDATLEKDYCSSIIMYTVLFGPQGAPDYKAH